MKKKIVALILLLLIILSLSIIMMSKKEDYGSLICIDNKMFAVTNEPVEEDKTKSGLGKVIDITKDLTYEKPSKNFQSNELKIGTEVYAIDFPMENHRDELIAVKIDNKYYLCRPYFDLSE